MIRVREVMNWLNLSTPLGLLIAIAGGATIRRGVRGTHIAVGYRWRFALADVFTIGNVIVTSKDEGWLDARPRLLCHEDRHCTQYAWCVGPGMVVLYVVSAGVSWALSGNHASYNPFERLANLDDGGYAKPVLRTWGPR